MIEYLYLNPDTSAYETKDLAWLQSIFGTTCYPLVAAAPENSIVFRLYKVVVTKAEASFNVHLENLDGSVCYEQPVAFTYPSLENPDPELRDLANSGVKSLWSKRGIVQYTDQNGQTGFGVSQTGWYKDPGAGGGPGSIWPLSLADYADGITGLCMIGGTFHFAPTHFYFRETKVTGPTTPPNPGDLPPVTPPVADAETVRAYLEAGQKNLELARKILG